MNATDRKKIIFQISDLLDICENCPKKKDMLLGTGKDATLYSKLQRHCNKKCKTGKELQSLGKQLDRGEIKHVNDSKKPRRIKTLDRVLERV